MGWDRTALRREIGAFPGLPGESLSPYLSSYGLDKLSPSLGWLNDTVLGWRFEATQPRASLVLVPGYLDHMGTFASLITQLVNLGFNVYSFDLPGQGLSRGQRARVDSFDEYHQSLLDLLAQVPEDLPRFCVAQSTGCCALMRHWQLHGGVPFEQVAWLNPLVRPFGWDTLQYPFKVLRFFVRYVYRRKGVGTHDPAFNQQLEDDAMQSRVIPVAWLEAMNEFKDSVLAMPPVRSENLTIFQGTEEFTVDGPWNTELLQRRFLGSRLILIEGARHHLANETTPYRAPVLDLFATWVS